MDGADDAPSGRSSSLRRRSHVENLVENELGCEITYAAIRSVDNAVFANGGRGGNAGDDAVGGGGGHDDDDDDDEATTSGRRRRGGRALSLEAERASYDLMDTSHKFLELRETLLAGGDGGGFMGGVASMTSATHAPPPVADAPAVAVPPPSLSLFALLDSRRDAASSNSSRSLFSSSSPFFLRPRITADMILVAHRRRRRGGNDIPPVCDGCDVDDGDEDDDDGGGGGRNEPRRSALELLEMADDVEDLSPDPDSWELIRTILFDGLTSSCPDDAVADMAANRYLKIHVTLHEKCLGNVSLSAQLWDLVSNMIGSILVLSRRSFGGMHSVEEDMTAPSSSSSSSSSSIWDRSLDLCFDVVRSTLATLANSASNYVVSGVGREREVEMTLMGMSALLCDEYASTILCIVDPYAGTFEVWSRFVDPDRFASIMVASGLVCRVLLRCGVDTCTPSVGNGSMPVGGGEYIRDAAMASTNSRLRMCGAASRTASSPHDPPTLAEVERCYLLQSLSILRTVVFICHGSPGLIASNMIRRQRSDAICSIDATFLSTRGAIAISGNVQSLIEKAEEYRALQSGQPNQLDVNEGIVSLLEPFLRVIRGKEPNGCSMDSNLETLCTQTILLIQQSVFIGKTS